MLGGEAASSSCAKRPLVDADVPSSSFCKKRRVERSTRQQLSYVLSLCVQKMTVNRNSVEEHQRFARQLFALPENEWDDTQMVKVGKEAITLKDLGTLRPKQFLNDVVINAYMDLITARAEQYSCLPKVYTFSTFFYASLTRSGYSAVCRYTRRVNIFDRDLLVVPIHDRKEWHWTLAAIDLKRKRVTYYDPLETDETADLYTPSCLLFLRNYLRSESKDKLSRDFDLEDWSFENATEIPRQRNDFDCGVFVCQYADCLSRNQPVRFNAVQAPYIRRRMIYELCHEKILDV